MTKPVVSYWSSIRTRLVAVIFVALAPALGLMFYTERLWLGLLAGALAIAAAWVIGGQLIIRQVNNLLSTAKRLAAGDLSVRSELAHEPGELGELARAVNSMAASLQEQLRHRERAEKEILNRAHQQTVVAALGQFALQSSDVDAFLEHVVLFVSQSLEIEYSAVQELLPDQSGLRLRAGVGWKDGYLGQVFPSAGREFLEGVTLTSGEPIIIADLATEKRFKPSPLLQTHGVVSAFSMVITGRERPFGTLGAYSTRPRAFTEDEMHFLQAVATVISTAIERQRTEAELQKLAAFARFNPNPVLEFYADASINYVNDAALKMAHALGHQQIEAVLPEGVNDIVNQCLGTGQSKLHVMTNPGQRTLLWSFFPIIPSHVVHCYVEDATERLSLEAQLRQSQKMESIGQLAAGVAHDFNNMLTIIQGHSGLLLARNKENASVKDSAQAIFFAAERAGSLTRQLLLFSRKNVMQAQPLDLKELVRNMVKMLTRLLGENVTLEFNPPDDVPPIHADPGMVEQVLMNLSVNARDAMSKGGTLTLSTQPVEISDEYVLRHPEARPGLFICLRASDTGHGMDAATMSRIFEPFFTTKPAGVGTGLGLATVYGIVKQHQGWIEVASEVGKGTTFNIFFPVSAEAARRRTGNTQFVTQPKRGDETILIVEDEPVLRDLAQLILHELGYKTFEAATGREALSVWEKNRNDIDLLLTDIMMPEGMTGRELAEKLLADNNKLKVIYTSGYAVENLDLRAGCFLQKPYSRYTLTKAVRETLDAQA